MARCNRLAKTHHSATIALGSKVCSRRKHSRGGRFKADSTRWRKIATPYRTYGKSSMRFGIRKGSRHSANPVVTKRIAISLKKSVFHILSPMCGPARARELMVRCGNLRRQVATTISFALVSPWIVWRSNLAAKRNNRQARTGTNQVTAVLNSLASRRSIRCFTSATSAILLSG